MKSAFVRSHILFIQVEPGNYFPIRFGTEKLKNCPDPVFRTDYFSFSAHSLDSVEIYYSFLHGNAQV
jgi:hypothetical protein